MSLLDGGVGAGGLLQRQHVGAGRCSAALADEGELVAGLAPGDAAVVGGEAGDVAGRVSAVGPVAGMMYSSLAKEPSMRA